MINCYASLPAFILEAFEAFEAFEAQHIEKKSTASTFLQFRVCISMRLDRGYPSCVRVGRSSDRGHFGILARAVGSKSSKTPKK